MNRIITISREYGAGGHSIGRRVAEELGIPFYDRDIVKQTVKASGYDLDMVEHDEEDVTRTGFFLKSLCSVSDASFSDTQDAIHEVQSTVILHLAKEGHRLRHGLRPGGESLSSGALLHRAGAVSIYHAHQCIFKCVRQAQKGGLTWTSVFLPAAGPMIWGCACA